MSHAYTGDWTHYVGGGVAAFDCDLDGDPDLFFAGGASPSTLYRNDSAPGTLRFSAVVDSALVETGVTGAYPLDIDGDGTMDLTVLLLGANRLYRGLGECRFADAGEAWGVPGGDAGPPPSAPFGKATTGYRLSPSATTSIATCGPPCTRPSATQAPAQRRRGLPGQCPVPPGRRGRGNLRAGDWAQPRPLPALDALFRTGAARGVPNSGSATDRFYHEDTGEEQLLAPGHAALALRARRRLAAAQDLGHGDREPRPHRRWVPDYFLSNMGANRLRTLAPGSIAGPEFREIAFDHGVEARRPHAGRDERPSTAWHSQFADVNNDGWIDLFVAKGNVEEMEEAAAGRSEQPAPRRR